MQSHYGSLARILHWCTDQTMTAELEKMELTAAQGHIMGYLAHAKTPLCARDIENEFHLSHPTVSGLLSRLEQKGCIELRTDEHDRRSKRIYILPKGTECHDRMHRVIESNECRMVEGFTEAEKEQFAQLLTRAIRNMGGNPCQRKEKEDNQS